MEFRLLGPLEVVDGDTPVEIAGVKRKAVLALLILRANEVVGSERLIDELWGEQAPRNAAAALHNHVSRLRKALGPEVLARREWGYVLRTPPESIDLRRFERLLTEAEPLPAQERAARLAAALNLWRGPPLADLALEPGLQQEIAHLEELRLATVERRIDADLEAGRNSELVAELETLVSHNPLRERLRGQLILSLYRAGRQAEALEVYRETRRMLTEELGLDPSPALRELETAILRQDPSLAVTTPATPPAAPDPPAARRSRRVLVLGGLLGLLALGTGAAVAVALVLVNQSKTASALTTERSIVTETSRNITTVVTTRSVRPTHPGHRVHKKTATSTPVTTPPATIVTVSQAVPPPAPKTTTTRLSTATTKTTTTSKPTTTTSPKPTPKPPSTSATISDTFDGGQLDGTIWSSAGSGTGGNMSEHDGRLEFSFSASATPGGAYSSFGGNAGTQCRFPGDFDARRLHLPSWPPGNGIEVALWSFFPTNEGWQSWRRSSAQWGEAFGSYTGGDASTSVSLDDTSGTLRLARRNGLVTAYFLHNGAWQALTSGRNTSLATIAIGAGGGTGYNMAFGNQPVAVDFDNFTVTGTNPICPPGSQPPGS